MIFPFFKRAPKYKRFNYEPRYYDPIKEEINNRTEQIKRELKKDNRANAQYRDNISQAFKRRYKKDTRVSGMQFLLIILFMGTFVGYYFYGSAVLWVFVVLFPVYIFIRTRRFFE